MGCAGLQNIQIFQTAASVEEDHCVVGFEESGGAEFSVGD
jgi:hypothetical protein